MTLESGIETCLEGKDVAAIILHLFCHQCLIVFFYYLTISVCLCWVNSIAKFQGEKTNLLFCFCRLPEFLVCTFYFILVCTFYSSCFCKSNMSLFLNPVSPSWCPELWAWSVYLWSPTAEQPVTVGFHSRPPQVRITSLQVVQALLAHSAV